MSVCSLTFRVSFYPSEIEVSWLNPGPTFMAGCPTFGASISSFFRSHSIILAGSSRDCRVSFNHVVERASHTILPLVLMHAFLAIDSLFGLANSLLAFYIRASWRTRWVIVRKNQGGRISEDGHLEHLAGLDDGDGQASDANLGQA